MSSRGVPQEGGGARELDQDKPGLTVAFWSLPPSLSSLGAEGRGGTVLRAFLQSLGSPPGLPDCS